MSGGGKEVHELLTEPITCHCWNGDRTKLAISPNNTEVHIYSKGAGGKWELDHKLTEHTSRVTGMDWAPKSDSLVTCAADRNAYVWKYDGKVWSPVLVILRINRAATIVKWSPLENKFAVGSGARIVSICYFDKLNDWWVSKHIKKPIRSTITSVDWHPNNYLIAAGCTDFTARVFSAYVKEIEEKPSETVWGKKMPFGNLMAELSNGGGGWVHDVSFSPSGDKLAWVGHDSSISVVNMAAGADCIAVVRHKNLPYLSCQFLTENSIVAAGFDCYPVLWNHDDSNQLSFMNRLDQTEKKAAGQLSAMEKFKGLDKRATTTGTSETALDSTHQNAITQIFVYSSEGGNATKFSTSGVDGRLVVWNCKSLESMIAGLKF